MEGSSESKSGGTPNAKTKTKIPLEEMKHEDLVTQVKRQIIFLQKAKAKCDDLNRQIEGFHGCKEENVILKTRCEELENKLENCEKDSDVKKKELVSLLSTKDIELCTLKDDYIKVQKEKLGLEEQVQCLTMKNSTLGEMCQSFQQELSNIQKSRDDDKNQLILVTEARDSALNSLRDLKNMLKEKDSELSELRDEIKSSKEYNNKLLDRFESIMKEIESLTNQNSSLQDDYSNAKRQLKTAIDECDNWKAKVEELENEKDDYVGPPVDVSELQYKIEELEQELDNISREKQQLVEENESLNSVPSDETCNIETNDADTLRKIANFLEQIRNLEEDLLKATNQKDDLMDELEQVRDLQRFLEDETKELHEECRTLKEEIVILELQLKEDSHKISALQQNLSRTEEKEGEYHRDMKLMEFQLEESTEFLLKNSEDYEEKLNTLKKQLSEMDSKQNDLQEENDELKESFSQLQTDYDMQNENMEALHDQIKTLSLSNLNKTDEMKIEEYEIEISSLKEQLAFERNKIESLLSQPEQNIAQEEIVQSEVPNIVVVDVDATASKKNFQEFQMDEFVVSQDEPTASPSENSLQKEVADLTEALNNKTALVQSIHLQMDNLLSQIDELNNTVSEKQSDIESLASKMQAQTNVIEDNEAKIKMLSEGSLKPDDENKVPEELDKLKKEYEGVYDEKVNLQVTYNNLCDYIRTLEENESLLMQKLEQDESLREFCAELECRLDDLLQENSSLKKGLKELSAGETEMCTSCQELQNEKNILENKVEELSNTLNDLELTLQSMKDISSENVILKEKDGNNEALLTKSKSEVDGLEKEKVALTSKIMELESERRNRKTEIEELLSEKNLLQEKCNSYQLETDNFGVNEMLLKARLTETENKIIDLESKLKLLTQENNELSTLCQNLSTEKATLLEDVKSSSDEQSQLVSVKEENKKLQNELENLQIQIETQNDSLKQYEVRFNEISLLAEALNRELDKSKQATKDMSVKCQIMEEEHGNVVQKLNDMSQDLALKEDVNQKLNEEVDAFHKTVSDLKQKIIEISEAYTAAQRENNSLKDNLRERETINEQNQKSSTDQEDLTKRELTECKEKIEKLKKVVFKVKKELADSQKNLSQAKSVKEELSNMSLGHLQNFQSLQTEYDKLQDQFEALKDDKKKLEQDIISKVNETVIVKGELELVKNEKSKLQIALESEKLEKKQLELMKKEQESKVIILKSEKETDKKKLDNSQNQIRKLESDIKSLEVKLQFEKDAHGQTVLKLEQSLKSAKKHDVLNLEINDFEATIFNMEENLKEKDVQIAHLQKEIQRHGEKELFLKDEIERLNSQRLTEEYRFENLKDVVDKTKDELTGKTSLVKELTNKLEDSQEELEKVKTSKEEWQIQLSETSQQISSLELALKNSKESFSKTSKTYEARVSYLEKELSVAKDEVENTKKDFESYKVRVHSVLKQKQAPVTMSSSSIEEKERLEKSLEAYGNKLELLNDELKVKNVEIETYQQEHSLLISKIEKLMQEIKYKDENWVSKYEQLSKEKESNQMLWESERSHLIQQKELLTSNFKIQIESAKEEHQISIDSLQRQLDSFEREIIGLRQKELQLQQTQKTMQGSMHDESSFDVSSLERQEGEGSECTEAIDINSTVYKPMSLNTIPSSSFMPLEQLLQSNSERTTPSSQVDILALSNEVSLARRKIDHLVELLNESEANNMRLSEQVRLLKDEIRRLERNKEREEIASNLEYLKNVIIKFITLQEGNERERLVPVLTTMLKLSSEEQNHVQQVALGQYANAANNAGWGSYLQWSGLI